MKTLLGFTTGSLLGLIGGLAGTVYLLLISKDLREYIDKQAFDD